MLKTLERGLNGWHGHGVERGCKFSITFYSNDLDYCLKRAEEGTIIIDKKDMPEDKLIDMVLKGPMYDPLLSKDEINTFSSKEKKVLGDMLPGLDRTFTTIALTSFLKKEGLGSLDYVGLDIWVSLWREHGARIGVYQNGNVEWENV